MNMTTYFACFGSREETLEAAGALLQEGVQPEDLTVVVDESERLDGRPAFAAVDDSLILENDLLIERTVDESSIDYARTTDPALEPAVDLVAEDRLPLHESIIGGGISTATPDDSVSSVDEMDDSQAAAEEMLYRTGLRDSREREEERDPEEAVSTGIQDFAPDQELGSGIHGEAEGTGTGELAALLPAAVPGVGVVMGDGFLATSLLDAANEAGGRGLVPLLVDQGLPEDEAVRYAAAVASGGGLVAVSLDVGNVEQAVVQERLLVYSPRYSGAYIDALTSS